MFCKKRCSGSKNETSPYGPIEISFSHQRLSKLKSLMYLDVLSIEYFEHTDLFVSPEVIETQEFDVLSIEYFEHTDLFES